MRFNLNQLTQSVRKALSILGWGVYSITNRLTGKKYYGSTYNFLLRLMQHIYCVLRGQWVGQSHLYSAIKAEGMENFEYAVVLEMPGSTAELRI